MTKIWNFLILRKLAKITHENRDDAKNSGLSVSVI